jgi:hypothetical protein
MAQNPHKQPVSEGFEKCLMKKLGNFNFSLISFRKKKLEATRGFFRYLEGALFPPSHLHKRQKWSYFAS